MQKFDTSRNAGSQILLLSSLLARAVVPAVAWGSSSSTGTTGQYYPNESIDWLYSSSNIDFKVEGCVWTTTDDNEDVGCMEDGSEDGTTYWYQMAMCRRAQVAYSVYASSGSSSCSSKSFKGTFVTQDGLSEFAYIMGTYDGYSPISEDDTGDLPLCEQGNNGYYLSVGCASDGTFTIDQFSDPFCLQRVGTYDSLSNVNYLFKNNFRSCYNIYSANTNENVDNSAAGALISASKSCTELDSTVCQNNERIDQASSTSQTIASVSNAVSKFNVASKAKYALGSLCLVGSLFMFLGILFTNRRKRRAMMHRKMRSSKRERSKRTSSRSASKSRSSARKSTTSSKSRSRSRGGEEGRSSARSRSRARSSSRRAEGSDGGVLA